MHIPGQVKIGGYTYSVVRQESSFVSNGKAVDGTFDFANCEIVISEYGSSTYQNTVFLHELTHGLIEHYCSGCFYSIDDEEKFVEQFSKGLYQLIADNPAIFEGEAHDLWGDKGKAKKDQGNQNRNRIDPH